MNRIAYRQATSFNDILSVVSSGVAKYRRTIFKTILLFLIIGKRRKRISSVFDAFKVLLEADGITLKRLYCFLNSKKIPWDRIWGKVFELIGSSLLIDGRLHLLADDTTYGKTGKHIAGCDVHFDHAAKRNRSRWIFGHCRVVIGLQMFIHGRWACLPVAQGLYRRKKKPSKNNNKQQPEEPFTSKIEIAVKLINRIRTYIEAPTLVICDSWFGVKPLINGLQKNPIKGHVHILSRLRINACLYAHPKKQNKKTRGRPRKYGEKLPSIPQLAATLKANSKQAVIYIYGKKRNCYYSEILCLSQALRRKVKVVFIYSKNGRVFPLITTDLSLTAEQMIEYYSARWKIESGFKELKHELGALDNQARKKDSVENHFSLCCLAMTLTWIHAMKQDKAPPRYHPKPHCSSYSFSDARKQIEREYIKPINLSGFCPETVKRAGKLILQLFFQCAA
jgi:hypothetical protein